MVLRAAGAAGEQVHVSVTQHFQYMDMVKRSRQGNGKLAERETTGDTMGRMSMDTRARVVWMWRAGFPISKIRERLGEEGIQVSRKSLYHLVKKYKQTQTIADIKRAPRRSKLTKQQFEFVDEAMDANVELTSRQLFAMLSDKFPDLHVSLTTVKRARRALGWSSKKTRYCALISHINEEKRMTWCMDRVAEADLELSDVIWTDESSIQLESHRKVTYQKKGQPIRLAGRPKHPPQDSCLGRDIGAGCDSHRDVHRHTHRHTIHKDPGRCFDPIH